MSKTKYLAFIMCLVVSAIALPTALSAFGQQTAQSRTIRPASITGDLLDLENANDERPDTRASSGKRDYVGMSITLDAGSLQNIIGVRLDPGRWPTHHPGGYKVEVAESPSGPWMTAFQGLGQRGEGRVEFPAIRARYVRITATSNDTPYRQDWSIAEARIGVDPGQTAARIPPARGERPPDVVAPQTSTLKDVEASTDRNPGTRATSGTPNYDGMSITIDLGGEYELSRVVQNHGQWAEDYPAEYNIEVSRQRDESRFREVWRGRGTPGRSVAQFNPVATRYIRITALRNRDRSHWWSIAEIRTNRDPDVVEDADDRQERPIVRVTSQGFSNVERIADANNRTRATTNTPTYAGSWVQADLGGNYTVSRVIQFHEPDSEDHPRRYRIDLSSNGRDWQTVFEGRGEPQRSSATFTPVRARFVRISALAERETRNWWSIHRLKISG